jgi:hypothetical protein
MKFLQSHASEDWRENWQEAETLLASLDPDAQREAYAALDAASLQLEMRYPHLAGNCPEGCFLDELAIVRQFVGAGQ